MSRKIYPPMGPFNYPQVARAGNSQDLSVSQHVEYNNTAYATGCE